MTVKHAWRVLALKEGRRRYQGNPCLRGHSGERYVCNGRCVKCSSEGRKQFDKRNPERRIAHIKQWKLENPERVQASILRNQLKYPEKTMARRQAQNAVRYGKLTRLPCQWKLPSGRRCNNPKTHAHHDDYSKPLRVKWWCHHHHMLFHNRKAARRAKA